MAGELDSVLDEEVAKRDAKTRYDDVLALEVEERGKELGATLRQAVGVKPDAAAKHQALSKTTGVPQEVVERNEAVVAQQARVRDLINISHASPVLARQLADPDFAKLAHDDAEQLSMLEQGFAYVSKGSRALASSVPRANAALWGLKQAGAEVTSRYITGPLTRLLPILGNDTAAIAAEGFKARRQREEERAKAVRGATPDEGFIEANIYGGIASFGQSALTLPAAVLTRNQNMALVPMSAQTGGEAFGKARDAGRPLLDALQFATSQAVVEYATEKLPVSKLIGDLKAGTPFWKTVLHQAALEIPGEQLATVLQDLNEWAMLKPNAPFTEYLAERPSAAAATLISTIVSVGGQTTVARAVEEAANRIGAGLERASEAERSQMFLQQLHALAAASKLRERAPDTFGEFIQNAAEDGPVTDIYVSGAELAAVLQQSAVPAPASVQEQLGEAIATGGDVRIPIGEYTAHLAASDVGNALLPLIKTSPDAMSFNEAQVFYQEQAGQFQQQAEQILAEQQVNIDLQNQALAVQTHFTEQLAQANRFTPEVNAAYATLMRDFYVTMAQRLGITPTEMLQRYPLRVAAENVTGERVMDQKVAASGFKVALRLSNGAVAVAQGVEAVHAQVYDRLRQEGSIPEEAAISVLHEPSVEAGFVDASGKFFTRDEAYEAANVYGSEDLPDTFDKLQQPAFHGSPHDFEKFSLDAVGTGEGAQAYGWGLYFAENPAVASGYHSRLSGNPQIRELKLGSLRVGPFNGFDYSRRASENNVENVRASLAEDLLIHEDEMLAVGEHGIQAHVLKELDDRIANYYDPENDQEIIEAAKQLRAELAKKGAVKIRWDAKAGGVYQVQIPDEAVQRMLLWEFPLSAQPHVRAVLKANEDLKEWLNVPAATGRDLVAVLQTKLGGDKEASKYLHSLGIPGVRYLDAGSRPQTITDERLFKLWQKHGGNAEAAVDEFMLTVHNTPKQKERMRASFLEQLKPTFNIVVFDDSIVTITHKDGRPVTPQERKDVLEQASRGQIAFGPDITQGALLGLLKNADLSTFFHESGHFYLEVLTHIASQPGAPAEVVADLDTALKWMGVKDLDTWRAMTLEQKRPHHEKFARGFEAYIFEGKSPSVEAQSLFARFRAWMLNVYKSLKALNVELSDEVRSVFDRMLASSEAIASAEGLRAMAPMFATPEEARATTVEWQEYQELGAEARDDAVRQLQKRSLRDMKWASNARSRVIKELQGEAEAKRKVIRKEVEAEVEREPVYRAIRFLTKGEIDTEEGTEIKALKGYKLDREAVESLFRARAIPEEAWSGFPQRMLVKEGGLQPGLVAEMFGFTSGDDLVFKILGAEPMDSVIQGLTDQRMLERHGDLVDDTAITRAADEAVATDVRARFVATEIRFLARAGNANVLAKAAKQFAEAVIARKKVRDIRPHQYTVQEARAAKAALFAKNAAEKVVLKRSQLVNLYGARAAQAAVTEVEKSVRYLKRFEGKVESIDPEYVDQIHQLLERFDLRQVPRREVEKRASLVAWVEEQRAARFEPVIDKALLAEAQRQHYSSLSLEEFRGLVDAVKNIEHLGRLKKKLLTAKDEREFDERVSEASKSVRDNAAGTVKERKSSDRGPLVSVGNLFRGFLAEHRKFSSLVREMDGFKDGGALWELFSRTMNEAGDKEASMREQATRKLAELFKDVLKAGLGQKIHVEQVGASFTREERLGIALNMGNEVNRERVLTGQRWTPAQLEAVLDTLTKEEWKFVQSVWDYLESFRPEIAAKSKRVTGVEPEWVEPRPVLTKHGMFRGGYYPIKYDPLLDSRSEADDAAAVQRQMERGLYVRAQTRRGHLEARVESTGRRLRFDLGVVMGHVDQVIHDLAWHEWLIDANRLLGAKPLDGAIREHYGPEKLKQLKDALRDIAVGDIPAQSALERVINHVRHGATIVGLGWNVVTSLIQPLGLTQSMVRIGPKWVARGLNKWLGGATYMENTAERVYEKSEFMRLRGKTMQREINEIRNKVAGRSSAIEASFFLFIQKMQLLADMPTWHGAYEKAYATEAGMTDEKAIALADQAVRDSQGSGHIGDLAAVQRGGAFKKLWTNFYSFFNTTYNLAIEQTRGRVRKGEVVHLAGDYLLLFVAPAVLGTLIKETLKGLDDDPDEIAKKLAREQLNYLFGLMVGLREMGAAIQGFQGYAGPAGTRFFSEAAKLVKQVEQGEVDEQALKAAANFVGIWFHLPTGQVARTLDGIHALVTGKTENPGALLVGSKEN